MKKPLKIAQKIMGFCDMISDDNIGSFAASAAYFFYTVIFSAGNAAYVAAAVHQSYP